MTDKRYSMSDLGPTYGVCPSSEPLKYEDVLDKFGTYAYTKALYPDPKSALVKKWGGSLPHDAASRKATPIAEGVLYYFPNALAAVAAVSKAGNDQHNPGQPMHHARGKSGDHADCILRHLIDAGTLDTDGLRHSAKVAWRALALLQEEIEREEGAPLPKNARLKD